MTLRALIKKLQEKPDPDQPVEFLVYNATTGAIVCIDMTEISPALFEILASREKKNSHPKQKPNE